MEHEEYGTAFESGFGATRRFLRAQGAPVEEAEEVAQAAWARGWEYRTQLRDPRLLRFWVNSIARNLFHARFRKPIKVPLSEQTFLYTMDLASLELRQLFERCSGSDRNLLEQQLEGYSAEEIAQGAGISATGIRVRMLRIRRSLRGRTTKVR